jgi:predicted RNA methylase
VPLELTTLPGLADVCAAELRNRFAAGAALKRTELRSDAAPDRASSLTLELPEPSIAALHQLRTVVAIFERWHFDVPRPRALLGDALRREWGTRLATFVQRSLFGGRFTGLRLDAPGRESAVMQRVAEAMARSVGLPLDQENGDLLVRLRSDGEGWTMLPRTTARPLSVRPYRVCDRPGGLNAALAAAALWLAKPAYGARVLDAFTGAGGFALELAQVDPKARILAIDNDPSALRCAAQNVAAAGARRVELRHADATALEEPEGSFELILANPPWGDAVGANRENRTLYPAFLREAARLLPPRGRLVLITHELALTRSLLEENRDWRILHDRRVWQGGHHPWLLVLERRAGGQGR